MKQYFGAILRFFKAVFFTFGLLIFLFCVRRYLPGFNGSQGVGLVELRLCLAMAVVFSMAHTIITSDRVPIRISLIATGILLFRYSICYHKVVRYYRHHSSNSFVVGWLFHLLRSIVIHLFCCGALLSPFGVSL